MLALASVFPLAIYQEQQQVCGPVQSTHNAIRGILKNSIHTSEVALATGTLPKARRASVRESLRKSRELLVKIEPVSCSLRIPLIP